MPSSRESIFQTESIDLSAYLAAAGYEPTIFCPPGGTRAIFSFQESDNLLRAVIDYEQSAPLPAKRLLNARSWLFREASRVVREVRI